MPRLSVCIPVKNRSRVQVEGRTLYLLPNCIRSIMAAWNLADELEFSVADFHSDDWPLEEWIATMAAPVPVRVTQVDEPYSTGKGLNIAAENATGDWLLFVATDMVMTRQVVEAGLKHLARGIVYVPLPLLYRDPDHRTVRYFDCYTGTIFVTEQMFEAVGPYPEFLSRGLGDTVWNARCDRIHGANVRYEVHEGLHHQWHPYTQEFMNRCYPDGWKEDHDRKWQLWREGKLSGGAFAWPM